MEIFSISFFFSQYLLSEIVEYTYILFFRERNLSAPKFIKPLSRLVLRAISWDVGAFSATL